MPPVVIVIGEEQGQHVAIRLRSRSHPGRTDYWDANWIESEVTVHAGAFTGTFRASLRSEELRSFLDELIALDKTLPGNAAFNTMEGQLQLAFQGNGRGQVVVQGVAADEPGTGNRLSFAFDLDQTYLRGIIRSLEEAVTSFPVVGHPE